MQLVSTVARFTQLQSLVPIAKHPKMTFEGFFQKALEGHWQWGVQEGPTWNNSPGMSKTLAGRAQQGQQGRIPNRSLVAEFLHWFTYIRPANVCVYSSTNFTPVHSPSLSE